MDIIAPIDEEPVADQLSLLRAQIAEATAEAEKARAEAASTIEWLTFSHRAASTLGAQGLEGGLLGVLTEAAGLYSADAAAVVGDDLESVFASEDVSQDAAHRALMRIAISSAGKPNPLLIESLGDDGGHAIAVPLRVRGELRSVLCMWSQRASFQQEQLDALGLMGRMIELAIEREELLDQAHSEVEGTLSVLQYLVSDRRPDYSEHAMRVTELASAVGQRLGMSVRDRNTLRLAALVHDVGIMTLPHDFPAASEPLSHEQHIQMQQHPRIGSEIAKAAHFDNSVQDAVASHHERFDGSGYPKGLQGTEISLGGRILAVLEVFDSMSHRAYYGSARTVEDAIEELTSNAGVLYDPDVVDALLAELDKAPELPLV